MIRDNRGLVILVGLTLAGSAAIAEADLVYGEFDMSPTDRRAPVMSDELFVPVVSDAAEAGRDRPAKPSADAGAPTIRPDHHWTAADAGTKGSPVGDGPVARPIPHLPAPGAAVLGAVGLGTLGWLTFGYRRRKARQLWYKL